MSDETTKELVAALRFAAAVNRALPVDDEADRIATAALNRATAGYTPRKLTRKP